MQRNHISALINMESHRLLALLSIPWLLLLIFSTTLASASHLSSSPRLSIRPPRWLVRETEMAAAPKSSYFDEHAIYEYNQTIDHFTFRPESYTKFKQRYVVNVKHWGGSKTKSPIFVYLGAEESVVAEVSVVGLMYENAPQFKAMIVFIEHRFYGDSIPYGWPVERALKHKQVRAYLSTAQVLADYAEVILYLKKEYKADLSPVIVFGGSYGGMLASWFRLKYPHIAVGALASSAPILHHTKDYTTYFDIVSKDFRETSESCYWTIKKSFSEVARVASRPNGLAKLSKKFNFCGTVKNDTIISLNIRSIIKDAAQYDNPPVHPIEKACKAIDGAPKNAYILDKVLAALNVINNISTTACTDPDAFDIHDVLDSYSFESCMELIHQEGVVSKDSMFPYRPFSLSVYMDGCVEDYGVPSRAPSWFYQYYGGKNIRLDLRRFGSNIIFSNGRRDPWSPSGVLESISDTLVALTHPAAHCKDLLFSDKSDPQWLTDLRKKEMDIIRGWLSTYYADLRALNMA